jgi:hypothetical protein
MKAILFGIVTMGLLCVSSLFGQDPRVLEARVSDLERRVRALEEKLGVAGESPAEAKPVDRKKEMQDNRDEIMKEIQRWANIAYQHRTRPVNRGGGGGAFTGFVIPRELSFTPEGTISVAVDTDMVTLTMESAKGFGSISVVIGPDGRFVSGTLMFKGDFAKPVE